MAKGIVKAAKVKKDVAKDVAESALVNNPLYQSLKNSGVLGN